MSYDNEVRDSLYALRMRVDRLEATLADKKSYEPDPKPTIKKPKKKRGK